MAMNAYSPNQRFPLPLQSTHLADTTPRVRLPQPFPQRTRIDFQQPSLLHNEFKIPYNPSPNPLHAPQLTIRLLTKEPNEIKMPHNPRLQRGQHLKLRIEIILKQPLVRAASGLARLSVHGPVIIDRDLVHMMHRADKEVRLRDRHQRAHQGRSRRADPLALEADYDGDAIAVLVAEPRCFFDVRVMPGTQLGEGVPCFDLM